ncbi:MAG: helix-turn-helix transcriptional regulator [Alphaproteobacteria bacterium]|nr:helix-turn-helix transcriptional regulator [Alphaproteobacteria bacterium]
MMKSKTSENNTQCRVIPNILCDIILNYKKPLNRNYAEPLAKEESKKHPQKNTIQWRNIELTKREFECVYYIAHGKSFKEISCLLGLSIRTVEQYLNSAKEKTNKTNKTYLAGWFWDGIKEYAPSRLPQIILMN